MIDTVKVREFVRENAEQICRHFFPAGHREGSEWRIGDVTGKPGSSLAIELKGPKAGLCNDRAGGFSGDLIDLIAENRNLTFSQTVAEIERAFGRSFRLNTDQPETKARTSKLFEWLRYVENITDRDLKELAGWRGLSLPFCHWLRDERLIGKHQGQWGFPLVHETEIVSAHIRSDRRDKKGKQLWFYQPKLSELGVKVQPFIVGNLPTARKVICAESQWDLFSALEVLEIHEGSDIAGVSTRGAKNSQLLKGLVPEGCEIILLPQNDEPGEKWFSQAVSTIGRPARVVRTPEQFEDFNSWTKSKPPREQLIEVFEDAKIVSPEPEEPSIANTAFPPAQHNGKDAGPFPPMHERPCFKVHAEDLRIGNKAYRAGVYLHGAIRKEDQVFAADDWICAPLVVSAKTASKEDSEYGRLLEFISSHNIPKKWSMPMGLLAGDGTEILNRLLSDGLEFDYPNRKKIPHYLSSAQPAKFLRCATRTGWQSSDSFVLPDEVIGHADIWFQSGQRIAAYARAGTLEDWKQRVAAKASGNPFLMFALSLSLSGPLLERLNIPGMGVHLFGDSTTGKTTTLEAAASTWGGEKYRRAWRATANGLEGICVQHTDTLLILDEIAEINPKDLDEVTYFLLNGQGKTRSDRSGEARPATRWRVAVLSSGEQSIKNKLLSANITVKEGQGLRILDVPVSGHHGLFDELHDAASAAQFADNLRQAAKEHYGHAGPAFVKAIINQHADGLAARHNEIFESLGGGRNSQENRAARTFAVAALTGQLAAEAGIVPWKNDEAFQSANLIFGHWCAARETSCFGSEHLEILRRISDFIDTHSDSRFSVLNPHNEGTIYNRAGYWTDPDGNSDDSRIYLFTSGGLREATRGIEFSRVLKTLEEAGAFYKTGAKEKSSPTRTPDGRVTRLFWINPAKLESSTP